MSRQISIFLCLALLLFGCGDSGSTQAPAEPDSAAETEKAVTFVPDADDGAAAVTMSEAARASKPAFSLAPHLKATKEVDRALKETIIPVVAFDDTPLVEALQHLQQQSVELSDVADPAQRGITIEADPLLARRLGKVIEPVDFKDEDRPPDLIYNDYEQWPQITLHLKNVPLSKVLEETAALVGLRCYRVPYGVVIGRSDTSLLTRTYRVEEKVFDRLKEAENSRADRGAPTDYSSSSSSSTTLHKTFEEAGIEFGIGAFVYLDRENSRVEVHNTAEQVEQTVAFLRSLMQ